MHAIPKRLLLIAALLAGLVPAGACAQQRFAIEAAPSTQALLRVTALDVGQGDAILVELGAGDARKVLLIDGGPPDGATRLLAALAQRGVRAVDLLVISHPHLDHIGGLHKLLETLPVRAVLDSAVAHPTATYRRLLKTLVALKEAGKLRYMVARRGLRLPFGAALLEILGPAEPLVEGSRSDVNANSVVMRLVHGTTRFLFTGDAEAETEARLLASGDELAADVLKVAHHGSRHATSSAFLQRVAPRFALISAGRGNDYGHPTLATLLRLAEAKVIVLRTDLGASQTLWSDGEAVRRDEPASSPTAAMAPPQGGDAESSNSAMPTARIKWPSTDPAAKGGQDGQTAGRGDASIPIEPAPSLIASRRGKVFHQAGCPAAARITSANRIEYATRAEAEDDGRRPHHCLKHRREAPPPEAPPPGDHP